MSGGLSGEDPGAPPAAEARAGGAPEGSGAGARPRSRYGILRAALPWFSLLAAVLLLQRARVFWAVGDGHVRAAVQLAFLAAGVVTGVLLGRRGRPDPPGWPPPGALFRSPDRSPIAELAHSWWQHLGLAPLAAVSATFAAILASAGLAYPDRMRGPLFAADLLWIGILAGLVGHVFARALLRAEPHALSGRGIHFAPDCGIAWTRLSRALDDPEERVIRLYSRRRRWLPTCVLTYRSDAEFASARDVIAAHLPCGSCAPSRRERRLWAAFLVAWVAVSGALTLGMVALLLAPVTVLWALAGAAALRMAVAIAQVPEVVALLAWVLGSAIGAGVDLLRGAVCDHSLSEEA